MGFVTACPFCATQFQDFGSEYIGKRVRCRNCGKPFLVEARSAPAGAAPVPGTVAEKIEPGSWGAGELAKGKEPGSWGAGELERKEPSAARGDDSPGIWSPGLVVLDLYEVLSVLGEGGMGTVHRVRHRGWDMDLAVKSPKLEILERSGGADNFEREAETWVNLGLHLHVVSCHYVRRLGGIPRVFAEYVEGGSLADWISGRRLYEGGPAEAMGRILSVAVQFAWGLHYAHEQGLIHQDVKPANVMMTPDGIAKVTDFGLARARAMGGGGTSGGTLVVDGVGMTPEYASPEQMGGQALTRRSDLWSWGVSVLEMFTGERTWRTGSVAPEAMEAYLEAGPEDPAIPPMPQAVANVLRQCFQMRPEARPHDLLEAASRLASIYKDVVAAPFPLQEPKAGRDTAASLNNRALSLLDLGRPEEALSLWDQALKVEAQHAESTFNRGLVLWRRAGIADTDLLRDVEEAAKAHPGAWTDAYHLGLVHLERGDGEEALKALGGIHPSEENRREVEAALARARERLAATGEAVRRFPGFKDKAECPCLSGDGRLLAAVHTDDEGRIHLWDAAAGADIRRFEPHGGTGLPVSLYLNQDGRLAASGGGSEALVKVWDTATGRCLRTFQGHTGFVDSVRLSANAGWTLSASKDFTARLWETGSGRLIRTFEGHTKPVQVALFTRDERGVISASEDGTIRVWEIATGRCVQTLQAHAEGVLALHQTEDGRTLASSGRAELKLWELPSFKCLRTCPLPADCGRFVWLSPDGRYAAVGAFAMASTTFRLVELETGRCARTFPNIGFWLDGLAVGPSGTEAYATGYSPFRQSETIAAFRFRPPAEGIPAPFALSRVQGSVEVLAAQTAYEGGLASAREALAKGDALGAVSRLRGAREQKGYSRGEEAVELWSRLYLKLGRKSLVGGWPVAVLEGHGDAVNAACFLGEGSLALTGSYDKTVRLWEVPSGRCLRTFDGFEEEILALSPSADGKKAVVSGRYMFLLLDLASGERRNLEGTMEITSPCLSWDGRFVAFGSSRSGMSDKNTEFYLTNTASGNKVDLYRRHTDNVVALALSRDARFLLTGGGGFDMSIKLWDLAKGDAVRDFSRPDKNLFSAVRCVALTPAADMAIAGYLDDRVAFWEIASGRYLGEFQSGGNTSLAPSEDGRFLLAGGGLLELWSLDPPARLRTFEGHTAEVRSVAMSPDGRYALSASADKTARLWFLDWELEENAPAAWHGGARPHLDGFLTRRTPHVAEMPAVFTDERGPIRRALTRAGNPVLANGDLDELQVSLGRAGYGWLDPGGVRSELARVAAAWNAPPPLPDVRPRLLIRASGAVEEVPAEAFEPAFAPGSPVASSPDLPSHRAFLERAREAMKIGDLRAASGFIRSARALPGFAFRPEALSGWAILSRRLGRKGLAAAWESRPLEVGSDGVFGVRISADGRLAAACQNIHGRLWDCATGTCLGEVQAGGDFPICADLHPQGAYCITRGNCDGTKFRTSVWDIRTGARVKDLAGTGWGAYDGCFSPDGRLLLTGTDEGARLWDLASGRCVRELQGHEGRVNSARFTRDGAGILTGADDRTLRLWETASGRCAKVLQGHTEGVTKVVPNPDGRTAFGIGGDVRLWDLASGSLVRAFSEQNYLFFDVQPSPDLKFFFTGGIRDRWSQMVKELRLWETASGRCVWTFTGYLQIPSSLAMSEDGRYLLVGLTPFMGAPMMPMLKLWELDWELE